ncbi:MAG: hypothetical protein C4K49_12355 [Candidatus Thorarchaeota archaeon]|nr:MAG: hypothetical protein C4K49_12355 [Candidatus Thorarchaeota archaeon]
MGLSHCIVDIGLIAGFLLTAALFAVREERNGRRGRILEGATAHKSLAGIVNVMASGPKLDAFSLGQTVITGAFLILQTASVLGF